MYEQLQKNAFERVIFYSPHRSIYFLDEQSKELCQPGSRGKKGNKKTRDVKLAEP